MYMSEMVKFFFVGVFLANVISIIWDIGKQREAITNTDAVVVFVVNVLFTILLLVFWK